MERHEKVVICLVHLHNSLDGRIKKIDVNVQAIQIIWRNTTRQGIGTPGEDRRFYQTGKQIPFA